MENQWYAILDAREVPRGRPVGVTRFSEKLVLWRDGQGRVCCLADRCCHRGAALSCGEVADGQVRCPFHGFQYDASGRVTLIPANGRSTPVPAGFQVRAYAVREAWGFVWIWYGDAAEAPGEVPFFEDLKTGFSYSQLAETWDVHYTRAIENQLDVVHLPFVHRTTIGRGGKSLVNGPVVRWQGDLMTFYVSNTADRGQRPLRAEEITDWEGLYSLQLLMPNLWQNRVSPRLRIMAAFAPVDESHTRIYLRFYQRMVRIPLLRELMNGAGTLMDRVVLHQDRRVVLTQQPVKSGLQIGEHLVPGDRPIIEYRRRRAELLEQKKIF